MGDEQRRHLEQLHQTCVEHLRVLEQQAATFGAYVPAYIVTATINAQHCKQKRKTASVFRTNAVLGRVPVPGSVGDTN